MIARARMSALVSGKSTVVCPVADVTSLTSATDCQNWTVLSAGASDGSIGILVFNDHDGNNQLDNVNNVIISLPFDDRGGKVGIAFASNNDPIRFTRRGNLSTVTGNTFRIVSSNPAYARVPYDREVIVAGNTGRICSQIAPWPTSPGPGCMK